MGLIFYHNRKKPQYQFYIAKMCGRISRSNRSTKSLSRKNTVGDFPRSFCSPETPKPPQGGGKPSGSMMNCHSWPPYHVMQ